jgi:hypothetical protein
MIFYFFFQGKEEQDIYDPEDTPWISKEQLKSGTYGFLVHWIVQTQEFLTPSSSPSSEVLRHYEREGKYSESARGKQIIQLL